MVDEAPRDVSPWLSDLVCAVSAPTQWWCAPDGGVGNGIEGVWHGDVRVLSSARLTLGGDAVTTMRTAPDGAAGILTTGVARHLNDAFPDATVRVDRRRRVAPGRAREEVTVTSTAPLRARLEVRLGSDLGPMDVVRAGRPTSPVAPTGSGWARGDVHVDVEGTGSVAVDGDDLVLAWDVDLPGRGSWHGSWELRAQDAAAVVVAPPAPAGWTERVEVASADVRLVRWVQRALADLEGLRMAHADRPDDVFVAAGAPWYLTLFGRDTLWTARLLLPLGWELAASTLRVLAHFQGVRNDPQTAEQPGKILHEVRPATADHGAMSLPPVYFGTVDATSLWICLLHEAWQRGMADDQVAELLPHLEAALGWQLAFGEDFLHYVDETGHGLANQGWKDSHDSVQWHDGSLADAPIALCEVQAYAYQAAVAGAELLEHFGRDGSVHREWAAGLRTRFREQFWVGREDGLTPDSYPAIALDGLGRAVDSLTSNIGHLLGTGLLDDDEAAVVAAHLASPGLAGGFGLRTLSSREVGFSPLSYHGGSVWAHDTAIAITGLVRNGFAEQAAPLVDGLLAAAEAFDYRIPELHAGDARADVPVPVPYPASCRPQAWSSAAAVAVAAVGLPGALLTVR
ncbi:glycogen debranching N-terminal domain-containing protein [Kineococcus sp. DHX-1]|uniref:glycogen debranching N-terminal domain-containing protein n=1 Tax=Kineococcus sp. DHX-1 TaxID=3349638 RepID=UPI0036D32023